MNTTNVYKMAVFYVETCKWSVIPLKENSKSPLIPWQEFQKRLPMLKELKEWFLDTNNNVGVVTGTVSQLSVLDVDTKQRLSELDGISSPITALTKKGRHYYFRFNGETNSASKIAEHVDVRGEGGYVVAPGSVVDGFRYRFLNPVINTVLLKPFPKELLNVNPEHIAGRTVVPKPGVKPDDWLSKALEGLSNGNRNATFTSVAGRLHRDGHSPSNILTLLKPHSDLCGFDLGELQNVIQSVTRYENQSQNRQGKSHLQHGPGDKSQDIEEFLKGEEKVEWITPGLIAKSSIGFIAALPESLKTWLMADFALAAATGRFWLDMKVDQVKTLFIDQERWAGETRRRFKKLIKGKDFDHKDMAQLKDYLFIQTGSTIRLNLDESFEAFRRRMAELRPELVIVDSFATFHTSGENDRQEIQKVLERIKQLRTEFGCTFLFIDHEGKGILSPDKIGAAPDSYGMMGSVAKPAAAETVLVVRRASDSSVTLHHTKSTLAPAIPPITIQIVDTSDDGVKLVKL